MTRDPGNMPPDTQAITDTSADVYEAIATLEHGGHSTSRSAVIAATRLPDDVVDGCIDELVATGMLVAADNDGDPVYEPANRGWSAAPEQAEGHHLS
jgi:hypothetical protein